MSGKLKIKATPAGDAAATKAAASRARGHKPFGASEAKLHRPRYASGSVISGNVAPSFRSACARSTSSSRSASVRWRAG